MSLHKAASNLVYRALSTSGSVGSDATLRELVTRFRAEPEFAQVVTEMAEGMELAILDVSEMGFFLAPKSKDCRFALKLTDLRANMSSEQKGAMVLAHLAICATFFPDSSRLEDDSRSAVPATLVMMRDLLATVVKRLSAADAGEAPEVPGADQDGRVREGWELLAVLPIGIPHGERAALNSLEGYVKVALNRMVEYGLLRREREGEDDTQTIYTPTHRLRVQLRDMAGHVIFNLVRHAARRDEV